MSLYKKISIIGAGRIGALLAADLMTFEKLETVTLFDSKSNYVTGKVLDLSHRQGVFGHTTPTIEVGETPEDLAGSDVVVITASAPYTDISKRAEVTRQNAELITTLGKDVQRHCPDAFVIMVTNPVDVMTYWFQKAANHPKDKILGLSGELDRGRLRTELQQKLDQDLSSLEIPVLGAHWPNTVYLFQHAYLNGTPLSDILSIEEFSTLAKKASNGGAEIIDLLKNESTAYGPAAALMRMISALDQETSTRITGSTLLVGEYGWQDVAAGMDVLVQDGQIHQVIEYDLGEETQNTLDSSIQQTADLLSDLQSHFQNLMQESA